MPRSDRAPLVFLIAGETSSDQIGARLMRHLKRRRNGDIRFDGVGGDRMAAEGLVSRFPYSDLSLVGLTEVIPHIPNLARRMSQTARFIAHARPAAALFIDASGFSRGVARRLRGADVPLVQYKAPQAWAYWPWRARKMARYFDHVFTILPFEPEFFARYGVTSTFIGHPAVESGAGTGAGEAFRSRHGVPPTAPLLCVLPGSRRSEIKWSLPIFGETLAEIVRRLPAARVVVPTIHPVADVVAPAVAAWGVPAVVVDSDVERFDAFAASDAALAVSGTVTAELTVARLPMVVCYRVSPATAAVARRVLRVRYVSIANLVLDRPAVPELIQEACRPDRLAEACCRILSDPRERAAQVEALNEAAPMLRSGALDPTDRAAEILLQIMK